MPPCAQPVLLGVDMTVLVDGQVQHVGERVHHRHANAMQAAGDLVGAVIELTAGMQHGHDDLRCRPPLFGMDVHRDAAPVVAHGH